MTWHDVALAALLALATNGCAEPAHAPPAAAAHEPIASPPIQPEKPLDVEITLVRSECCGGYCPNYTVVISGDGQVKYTGRSFVRTIGERGGSVSQDAVQELLHRFDEAKFFDFHEKYRAGGRDCPTAYLTLRVGDRNKTVENYFHDDKRDTGSGPAGPGKESLTLSRLARSIDSAVNVTQWTGTWDELRDYYVGGSHGVGQPGRTDLAK
jgi:hypothetical protein